MPGTFILSLDTEIAWGTYTNLHARAAVFDRYPELLRRLIRQLDIFEIPATWAVVGHLLLDEGTQPQAPQPHYTFAAKPDTHRVYHSGHPAAWFYGRYVIDAIQAMRVPQEIASHTLTHLLAGDAGVSRELFVQQLAETVALHTTHGLAAPRSLVYPRNQIAHTECLADHGFIAYRGEQHERVRLPAAIGRLWRFADYWLATPPPTYDPATCETDHGVVNLPASQFLMSYDGIRSRIPTRARVEQARRGLADAAAHGTIYHLWFHPFNLGSGEAMFDALTQILALVWHARERGAIQTLTMAGAAETVLSSVSGRL